MIYYFLAALSIRLRKYADNWQNAKKCSKILRRMQREVRYCCTAEMVLIRIGISCCRTQKSRCPVCRAAALKNAKKVRCSVVSAADRSARRQCRQTLPAGWSPPTVRAGRRGTACSGCSTRLRPSGSGWRAARPCPGRPPGRRYQPGTAGAGPWASGPEKPGRAGAGCR